MPGELRLEVELPIPDHTTLSRRLKKPGDISFRRLATDRPIHLLIDSTGLRTHSFLYTSLGSQEFGEIRSGFEALVSMLERTSNFVLFWESGEFEGADQGNNGPGSTPSAPRAFWGIWIGFLYPLPRRRENRSCRASPHRWGHRDGTPCRLRCPGGHLHAEPEREE